MEIQRVPGRVLCGFSNYQVKCQFVAEGRSRLFFRKIRLLKIERSACSICQFIDYEDLPPYSPFIVTSTGNSFKEINLQGREWTSKRNNANPFGHRIRTGIKWLPTNNKVRLLDLRKSCIDTHVMMSKQLNVIVVGREAHLNFSTFR